MIQVVIGLGRPYNTWLQQKEFLHLHPRPQRKTEPIQFLSLFLHRKYDQTFYFLGKTCRICSQLRVSTQSSPTVVKIFIVYRFNDFKFMFDVTTFSEIIKEAMKSSKTESVWIDVASYL